MSECVDVCFVGHGFSRVLQFAGCDKSHRYKFDVFRVIVVKIF